jgi:hypothetical protein
MSDGEYPTLHQVFPFLNLHLGDLNKFLGKYSDEKSAIGITSKTGMPKKLEKLFLWLEASSLNITILPIVINLFNFISYGSPFQIKHFSAICLPRQYFWI